MRTGRNLLEAGITVPESLDHWDMRTGRNVIGPYFTPDGSLDHWDMRTGRNTGVGSAAFNSSLAGR